jgi:hypothetical protein
MRIVLIAAMCVALVGCQVSTAPTSVATFDRLHAVSMMRAPWNGVYTLYLLPSDRKGKHTVVQTAHLKIDDALGFRHRETGPVAVAGELEVPLAEGEYEWVMQPDPGQTNGLATTALVVLIVAVVVGIIIAVIAVNVDESHRL